MEMIVDFPGGSRVDARFGEYIVKTDQPKEGGGDGSAPTPFDTFLASLGTCAGIYVLGFCRHRELDPAGIRLVQKSEDDPTTGLVTRITLDIQLPAGFPEKYRAAVIQAAELCKVKKHFEHPPIIDVTTSLHT
jgi:ribosomal protein S12 methylthiotransferase accessory factor